MTAYAWILLGFLLLAAIWTGLHLWHMGQRLWGWGEKNWELESHSSTGHDCGKLPRPWRWKFTIGDVIVMDRCGHAWIYYHDGSRSLLGSWDRHEVNDIKILSLSEAIMMMDEDDDDYDDDDPEGAGEPF